MRKNPTALQKAFAIQLLGDNIDFGTISLLVQKINYIYKTSDASSGEKTRG